MTIEEASVIVRDTGKYGASVGRIGDWYFVLPVKRDNKPDYDSVVSSKCLESAVSAWLDEEARRKAKHE